MRGLTALATAAGASLAVWTYLLADRGGWWRADERLPAAPAPRSWPAVAVVIPARDEAGVLPQTLPTVLGQDYPGHVAVVVVDDRSTDATAEVAAAARPPQGEGAALRVVRGVEAPPGWSGKVWALRQGLDVADGAELVLFTDADIAHAPDSLRRLAAHLLGDDLDLVSVMARLATATPAERLLVPAFVYFFAQLYPFSWVNRPRKRTAAAAGGCVLLRRAALDHSGGVEALRGALIDDVALARAVKRDGGGRVWLGFADGVDSVRAYGGLRGVWEMVARTAFTQLRNSPLLVAGTVAAMVVVYAAPVAAAPAGVAAAIADPSPAAFFAAAAGTAAWVLMATTYLPTVRLYGLHPARALTLPAVALAYTAMTLDSARRHRRRGAVWKGRAYTPARPAGRGR